MKDGTISGNFASSQGGGVYASTSVIPEPLEVFRMQGGTIAGNAIVAGIGGYGSNGGYGGGVFLYQGIFIKKGEPPAVTSDVIYGKYRQGSTTEFEDSNLANTAANDGHAVWINNPSRKRNSTAGPGVTLDSGNSTNWE
jgi:predicted outer membrane repeat protein